MKPILIPLLMALLWGLTSGRADAPPTKQESEFVAEQIRNFWVKSKSCLRDDWTTFKEVAQLTLSDPTKQINAVAAKACTTASGYFQLRLQTLKEQRACLSTKIGELYS